MCILLAKKLGELQEFSNAYNQHLRSNALKVC
jgi:hypothetical protein